MSEKDLLENEVGDILDTIEIFAKECLIRLGLEQELDITTCYKLMLVVTDMKTARKKLHGKNCLQSATKRHPIVLKKG